MTMDKMGLVIACCQIFSLAGCRQSADDGRLATIDDAGGPSQSAAADVKGTFTVTSSAGEKATYSYTLILTRDAAGAISEASFNAKVTFATPGLRSRAKDDEGVVLTPIEGSCTRSAPCALGNATKKIEATVESEPLSATIVRYSGLTDITQSGDASSKIKPSESGASSSDDLRSELARMRGQDLGLPTGGFCVKAKNPANPLTPDNLVCDLNTNAGTCMADGGITYRSWGDCEKFIHEPDQFDIEKQSQNLEAFEAMTQGQLAGQ